VEIAQTVINAAVVALVGLAFGWILRGQRRDLKADINEVRAEVSELRRETKQEFLEVRREISEVRSDITRVALAVGAKPRAANS
jgi:ribosomal protein L29